MYRAFIGERFGFGADLGGAGDRIWVHAVSAGETNAAGPLIERLLARGCKVVVTNMTPTGRARVQALFGDRVDASYAPYDMPGAINRFLNRARPDKLIIIDTELWPNMIRLSKARGLAVALVNARLSEKSARGYARIAGITRDMLNDLTLIAAQTAAHGARFCELGLPAAKLVVTGSIKFDLKAPADLEVQSGIIRQKTNDRPVLLAASTHPGEDELILDAFVNASLPDALLVLAPRHTHRADSVLALCAAKGLSIVRHSDNIACDKETRVLLLDTMGELMYFFNVARLAFVGGSLVPGVGGHNPMEPASLGVPIIMGPYLRNIEDIAAGFREKGGLCVVQSGEELNEAVRLLMNDASARSRLVEGANQVMAENRGALDRVLQLVIDTSRQ